MSALTTLFGFGSMLVGQYRGLVTLGLVMCIGIICTLTTSMIVLPQILALMDRASGEDDNDPVP